MSLSAEDRLEIHELLARFAHALDEGDGEAFAATFTEDGTFWNGLKTVTGRAALLEMGAGGVPGRSRHFNTDHLIEGDGDKANLKAYLLVTRGLGQEPIVATCNDDLVKVDGKWLFAYRRVTADKRTPRVERTERPAAEGSPQRGA